MGRDRATAPELEVDLLSGTMNRAENLLQAVARGSLDNTKLCVSGYRKGEYVRRESRTQNAGKGPKSVSYFPNEMRVLQTLAVLDQIIHARKLELHNRDALLSGSFRDLGFNSGHKVLLCQKAGDGVEPKRFVERVSDRDLFGYVQDDAEQPLWPLITVLANCPACL